MCSPTAGAMLPYGLKIPSPYFPFGPGGGVAPGHLPTLDFQRSQISDYNVRVQLGLRNYQHSLGLSPFHAYLSDPYAQAYFYKHDPRARFVQEEPKPSHSYIGLIGMAILNSKDKKLVLSDIYQWILDNYAYFRTRGPGWRNSIRHNLSLNDCFIKSGRSANGKGHYWAVHPANVDDFERGDFRRRRAQRKVRRHMGLSVPDDDDSPSPSPTQPWAHHDLASPETGDRPGLESRGDKRDVDPMRGAISQGPDGSPRLILPHQHHSHHHHHNHHHHHQQTPAYGSAGLGVKKPSRKRLFDMASLLAPDDDDDDVIQNKIVSDKNRMYEDNIINASSPGKNHQDSGALRREEELGGDNSRDGETKYNNNNNRNNDSSLAYQNHDMSDDDGDNDDEDEDNAEEIHVTSDDELSAERSLLLESNNCDTDKRLSSECDGRYSERDEVETGIYGIRRDKDSLSPVSRRENAETQIRPGVLNGITDKENILQNQIREMYPNSLVLENSVISRDNGASVYERSSEMQGHGEVSPSPNPHVEQTRSLQLNHCPEPNTSAAQDRQAPVSPLTRSDRLTIPLSITVNSSNFPSPVSQNSSLVRHSLSDPTEALSSQNSMLFRGSTFKSDLPKMTESKPVNGEIRRTSLDPNSVHNLPEIMRLQTEGFNWQPFPKDLVRERFSAFNVLDGRSRGLVSHFHQGLMRGVHPFSQQTTLSHSSALTQGISSSPLQASSAIPVAAAIPSPAGSGQHSE